MPWAWSTHCHGSQQKGEGDKLGVPGHICPPGGDSFKDYRVNCPRGHSLRSTHICFLEVHRRSLLITPYRQPKPTRASGKVAYKAREEGLKSLPRQQCHGGPGDRYLGKA